MSKGKNKGRNKDNQEKPIFYEISLVVERGFLRMTRLLYSLGNETEQIEFKKSTGELKGSF